jgi:hypothetical protein
MNLRQSIHRGPFQKWASHFLETGISAKYHKNEKRPRNLLSEAVFVFQPSFPTPPPAVPPKPLAISHHHCDIRRNFAQAPARGLVHPMYTELCIDQLHPRAVAQLNRLIRRVVVFL